jgi:hypothetical protein
MADPPKLKITYDAKNFPASAKCSACGEEMPRGEVRTAFKGEKLKWLKDQFDLHKTKRHGREDAAPR